MTSCAQTHVTQTPDANKPRLPHLCIPEGVYSRASSGLWFVHGLTSHKHPTRTNPGYHIRASWGVSVIFTCQFGAVIAASGETRNTFAPGAPILGGESVFMISTVVLIVCTPDEFR